MPCDEGGDLCVRLDSQELRSLSTKSTRACGLCTGKCSTRAWRGRRWGVFAGGDGGTTAFVLLVDVLRTKGT